MAFKVGRSYTDLGNTAASEVGLPRGLSRGEGLGCDFGTGSVNKCSIRYDSTLHMVRKRNEITTLEISDPSVHRSTFGADLRLHIKEEIEHFDCQQYYKLV